MTYTDEHCRLMIEEIRNHRGGLTMVHPRSLREKIYYICYALEERLEKNPDVDPHTGAIKRRGVPGVVKYEA